MTNLLLNIVLLLVVVSSFAGQVTAQNVSTSETKRAVKSVRLSDVTLHYIESGKGIPVVLVAQRRQNFGNLEVCR